nr:hypothetical protein [Tanacetum cinerariifolium]
AATITVVATAAALTLTTAPSAARRRKGVVIRDTEETAKKHKLDEEVEELRKHLQIMPNDDDDVYTEATSLALKVPVVDYEIYTEHNKPYFKIKRADAGCTSSNLEESKKCPWFSEGQELETVRVLWRRYALSLMLIVRLLGFP